MSELTFVLRFPDESPDVGNSLADELRQELLEADQTLRVERRKDNIAAQDFGATLVLILGTGAAATVARGVANWMARNSGVRVVIQRPDGTVVAEHMDSKNAADIIKAAIAAR